MTPGEEVLHFELAMLTKTVKDVSNNNRLLRKRVRALEEALQIVEPGADEGREDADED